MISYINDQNLLDLINKLNPDNLVFIDIREPYEYSSQHIPNSINVPVSELGKHSFIGTDDKAAIFYCRAGIRTRSAEDLIQLTGFKKIYCLEGGIEQWQRCGFKIETKKAGIDIMRQVQMMAGALVLLATILTITLSFVFIWIIALIGAGLILAGITGYCGMAKLLMRMPWNKHSGPPTCVITHKPQE